MYFIQDKQKLTAMTKKNDSRVLNAENTTVITAIKLFCPYLINFAVLLTTFLELGW